MEVEGSTRLELFEVIEDLAEGGKWWTLEGELDVDAHETGGIEAKREIHLAVEIFFSIGYVEALGVERREAFAEQ